MRGKIYSLTYEQCKEMILNYNYLKRMPSISFAYGWVIDNELKAICTFGKPASDSLCRCICGDEYKDKVFELNRLVTKDKIENISSFVSNCLKRLKYKNIIIVSYADTSMGHLGIIYQACNFIYTGVTKERTDKYVTNGKHSRHYSNKEQHNERLIRMPKHRYIYFVCNKTWRKIFKSEFKLEILPHPKGITQRYEKEYLIESQILNTDENKIYKVQKRKRMPLFEYEA